MSFEKTAQQLKALGDPSRLAILELLPLLQQAPTEEECQGVYNVSELAEELEIPQSTVSHHLKVLFHSGLVRSEKMCRDVYYWVDQSVLEDVMASLMRTAEAYEE
jgi:DNA-binding transcriptional ArsR family regulator